jgi:DNA-binding response OmpR family regulator
MVNRSALNTPSRETGKTRYVCGDVEVDCAARVIRIAGRRQLLTFGEFELLLRLVKSGGKVLTREQLLIALHHGAEPSVRAVDTQVTRLRHKLCEARLFQIETVQRVGYRCYWSPSSDLMLGTKEPRTKKAAKRRAVVTRS